MSSNQTSKKEEDTMQDNSYVLYYSVLQYIPSSIRQESMNVGIAFHSPEEKYSEFHQIRLTKRLSSFDDEYDAAFFRIIMDSLHYDLDFPVKNSRKSLDELSLDENLQRFDDIDSASFLADRTAYLANEFQFLPVQQIETDKTRVQEDIDALTKTYLYYDRPKSDRITAAEVRKLLSRQVRSIHFKPSTNPQILGDFDKKPIFDYKIGESFIKAISFDYKSSSTMARELKSTLYDLQNAIEFDDVKKIKLVVNDDYTESAPNASKQFNKIIQGAEEKSKVKIDIVPLTKFTSSNFN